MAQPLVTEGVNALTGAWAFDRIQAKIKMTAMNNFFLRYYSFKGSEPISKQN
ncbi:hypothetical protein [Pinibacter soli]|uniref:Uncharacterized protein n=1 Tax=Pinibacter soli TaxID=3044211 RepID=A0ABT6RI47_9BACT|nr:hypothetical protein [Pinibacter soli]MDI3322249.1 hypothetical protein [Pinibacter soli]